MINLLASYLAKNQVIAGIIFVALAWVLFQVKDIVVAIFISYIFMAALTPAVDFLRRRKISKTLAVVIAYFTTLVLFLLLIVPLVPFLVSQIQALFKNLPAFLEQAGTVLGIELNTSNIGKALSFDTVGGSAFQIAGGVFGGLFSVITVFAVSFYLLLEYDKLQRHAASMFPKKYRNEVMDVFTKVNEKLGSWLRGQVVLSLFVGFVTWLALTILGIPFALPLAVLAGLLEIIPTVGPIIAAIPAVVVALTISPTMAIVVVIMYVLLQIVENNILVPRIMQRAVGLNPIVVILGIILGGKLLGIAGALISVPLISVIVVLIKNTQTVGAKANNNQQN